MDDKRLQNRDLHQELAEWRNGFLVYHQSAARLVHATHHERPADEVLEALARLGRLVETTPEGIRVGLSVVAEAEFELLQSVYTWCSLAAATVVGPNHDQHMATANRALDEKAKRWYVLVEETKAQLEAVPDPASAVEVVDA